MRIHKRFDLAVLRSQGCKRPPRKRNLCTALQSEHIPRLGKEFRQIGNFHLVGIKGCIEFTYPRHNDLAIHLDREIIDIGKLILVHHREKQGRKITELEALSPDNSARRGDSEPVEGEKLHALEAEHFLVGDRRVVVIIYSFIKVAISIFIVKLHCSTFLIRAFLPIRERTHKSRDCKIFRRP
ncbi:MAG: hypothetical protein BWX45_01219 [Deltaproteobacteria bacterium ADurb.Bin002]|nr:MAG: hypothetical protein BWX45_01219 [Deltaproteobacteria bacterium ADurb.Bin002]